MNTGLFLFFLHTSMTMLSIYNRPQCGLLMRSIHNYTKLCPLPADPSAVSIVHYEVFLDTHRLADWNSGVRVTRSLVLYVCFVDRCFSFCTFPFGHCGVCSSSIYGFWLLLWYLQTLHTVKLVLCGLPRKHWNRVIKDRWSLNKGLQIIK